jgi:hypothetical protein
MKRFIALLLGVVLVMNLAACGTILHPERKGQVSGRLDPGIVVLDAIGLFFFIVPGVIAFAVDFSNGTIYYPGGKRASLTDGEMDRISSNGQINKDGLASAIQSKAGSEVVFEGKDLQMTQVQAVNQLPVYFSGHSLSLLNRP